MAASAMRYLSLLLQGSALLFLSACQFPNSVERAEFDNYLKNSPTAPYTRLGVVLGTAAADLPFLYVEVSADGIYLAIILPNYKAPQESVLRVIALDSGKTVAEIHAVSASGLYIVPDEFEWSPTGHEFYVKMAFNDTRGGDWLSYDVETGKFSPDGEKDIAQMVTYSSTGRPDGYFDSRDFGMPSWDSPPAQPSLLGEARAWLFIKDKFYEVLLEVGIEQVHPDNRGEAYVYCQGDFVRKMDMASNFTPMDELLYYEDGDLVMVGGADEIQAGYHPLKIRFPSQKFERMFVTQCGAEQRIVLVTHSPENYTVYLLRTHPGYDFNIAAEKGGVPPW